MTETAINPIPALPEHWAARFFTIWTGQAFSLVGSSLVQFALVWWMTRQTGSATVLATASLVGLLPQIVLGPFVGALVDRWNRRLIMIIADTGIALATVVLIYLFATGKVQVWQVYAILFIRSLGSSFHFPAMSASTSLMVPKDFLARLGGFNQLLQGLISIFSPPLGALLISVLPTEQVLAIDIITAAMAVIPLLFIPIPQPPRTADADITQATTYWHDLREGFAYMIKWPGLSGVILLAMLLNFLLVPSSSLTPLVVNKVFGKGALELAWVETALGIGTIVGGLILGAWGGFRRKIITCLFGIIGIGLGVFFIGVIPSQGFYLLLGAYFLMGFAQVLANGPLIAIFQTSVAPEIQGRIFSLIGAGAAAMMPISLLVAGPVADHLGTRAWYIFGGISCLVVTVVAFFIPVIMNIEENRQESQPVSPVQD